MDLGRSRTWITDRARRKFFRSDSFNMSNVNVELSLILAHKSRTYWPLGLELWRDAGVADPGSELLLDHRSPACSPELEGEEEG
ncbi:hypothetical protein LIER_17567 [Lithospermum erythrorhizon]|uniref:Uncharacterized protein n=1 Tax=Lithospermum erythrorhizon TaxID=34254 RepID=A0AAV3QB29_LITER